MYGETRFIYILVLIAGCAATFGLVSIVAHLGLWVIVPATLIGFIASMFLAGTTCIYVIRRRESKRSKN